MVNAGDGPDQLHPLQTRMSVPADDDVVVHGNAERGGDLDDRFGHVDIGLRERRIAGGMVVHHQIARPIALKVFGFYDVVAIIGG